MAGLTKGRAVCAALALVLSAAWLSPRALAQGATDYPIPSSAKEAYSPIGEGFEVPIEPRAELRGPKPYVDATRTRRHGNSSSEDEDFIVEEVTSKPKRQVVAKEQQG
jgi:hypothetical protein